MTPLLEVLQRALRLFLVGLVLLPAAAGNADTGGAGQQPDLRLLIDISGSMKTSDPDNLRGPALEMLVRMLPDGSRAGVWIFGESVEVLVPHREVDANWRAWARAAMARIDNSGQRTNIPAALEAASYDLERMDPGYRTSIVLLTDGKVDVAESPMINAGAARELLEQRAPELGATGVAVHTIALSDEADWVFLRSLAQATSGIAEQAQTAEALSGIFLQSLEMVAPTARVPLAGDVFTIDESVQELTALVFFTPQSHRVRLRSPSGKVYRPAEEGGDWFVNDQFALVTITSPQPGQWRLEAPADSEARITVISDLALEVDPLPNSVTAGKRTELGVRLVEAGKAIVDPEVLGAFSLSVAITNPRGRTEVIDVSADYPPPPDGEYRVLMPAFAQAGRYEVMVQLRAETLARELPMHVQVNPLPDQATLVTRGYHPAADDYRAPLAALLGVLAAAALVVWWILRRRKKRKLEIWERRARQAGESGEAPFALSGVSTEESEAHRRLD